MVHDHGSHAGPNARAEYLHLPVTKPTASCGTLILKEQTQFGSMVHSCLLYSIHLNESHLLSSIFWFQFDVFTSQVFLLLVALSKRHRQVVIVIILGRRESSEEEWPVGNKKCMPIPPACVTFTGPVRWSMTPLQYFLARRRTDLRPTAMCLGCFGRCSTELWTWNHGSPESGHVQRAQSQHLR